MATRLKETWEPSQGDIDHGAIDCTPYLDDGETVNGSPVVADTGSSGDLAFSNEAVSVAELTIKCKKVSAGKAVQFTFQGQLANTEYVVLITFTTSAGRTKNVEQLIKVAA